MDIDYSGLDQFSRVICFQYALLHLVVGWKNLRFILNQRQVAPTLFEPGTFIYPNFLPSFFFVVAWELTSFSWKYVCLNSFKIDCLADCTVPFLFLISFFFIIYTRGGTRDLQVSITYDVFSCATYMKSFAYCWIGPFNSGFGSLSRPSSHSRFERLTLSCHSVRPR